VACAVVAGHAHAANLLVDEQRLDFEVLRKRRVDAQGLVARDSVRVFAG
jgi:hypothetical protein